MYICHFETDDVVTDEMVQCYHAQEVYSSCFFLSAFRSCSTAGGSVLNFWETTQKNPKIVG